MGICGSGICKLSDYDEWTGSFKVHRYSSIGGYDGGDTCTYCDAVISQEDHTFKECANELKSKLMCVYTESKFIDEKRLAAKLKQLNEAILERVYTIDTVGDVPMSFLIEEEEEEKEPIKEDGRIAYQRYLDDALTAELNMDFLLALSHYKIALNFMIRLCQNDHDMRLKVDYYLAKCDELKVRVNTQ
jgi:hypothetical protein